MPAMLMLFIKIKRGLPCRTYGNETGLRAFQCSSHQFLLPCFCHPIPIVVVLVIMPMTKNRRRRGYLSVGHLHFTCDEVVIL
jgi:hypothetical protein